MGDAGGGWINKPFLDALDYFTNLFGWYINGASKIGVALGLVAVLWYSIQLLFGTIAARKVLVTLFTRAILFTALMTFYYPMTQFVKYVALNFGSMGSGKQSLTVEMADYMQKLERIVEADNQAAIDEATAAAAAASKLAETPVDTNLMATMGFGYADDELNIADLRKAESDRRLAARSTNPDYKQRTLAAIKSVLKPEKSDGTAGSNNTRRYFLDMELKNTNGKSTGFLSPSSILRLSVVTAKIMWERQWTLITTTMEEKIEAGGFMAKAVPISQFEMHWLFDMLLTFICELGVIFATIFAIIQYVMTILEYTIMVSVAILLVPFMIFDGTKDIAQKIIPAFFGLALKLVIITVCMWYCIYTYFHMMMDVISEINGMNLELFAYVTFTILITFVLTQNAPKIAMTLLTGSPQLSMGEFVAAAGTVAAGAAMTGKALTTGNNVLGATARGGVNAAGGAASLVAAGKAAAGVAGENGASGFGKAAAAMRGVAGEAGRQASTGLKNVGQSILHAGQKGGGAGGGGGGGGKQGGGVGTESAIFADGNRFNTKFGNLMNADRTQMTAGEHVNALKEDAIKHAAGNERAHQSKKSAEAEAAFYEGEKRFSHMQHSSPSDSSASTVSYNGPAEYAPASAPPSAGNAAGKGAS